MVAITLSAAVVLTAGLKNPTNCAPPAKSTSLPGLFLPF